MHLFGLELLGHSLLDRQRLGQIVTRLTITLSVATLAELFLSNRLASVVTKKGRVVPEKGHGKGVSKILALMTGSTGASIPLGLMFMTLEALAHRRDGCLIRSQYACMTGDALATYLAHGQMPVVVEGDLAVGPVGRSSKNSDHPAGIFLVALVAQAGLGQLGDPALLGRRVTGRTSQAIGLRRPTAVEFSQVHYVRKTRIGRLGTRAQNDRRSETDKEHGGQRTSAFQLHHALPFPVSANW
jgi:hypothetical protein